MKRYILLILLKGVFILPASAAIVILNGLSHKFKVKNGEIYKGVIEVSNTDISSQTVKLYQTDYSFSSDGSTYYDVPGTIKRSNAKWIELSENIFVLGPREKKLVNYQIAVPANDTLNGTFWSVIMVEGLLPIDTLKPKGQFTLNTVTRYGIQIITTAGDDGKKELIFNSTKITGNGNKRTLVADIKNTGDFMLETLLISEFYDTLGQKIKLKTPFLKKLYPGTSALFEIDINSILPGFYNVLIIADCLDEEAFGIQMKVEIKNE